MILEGLQNFGGGGGFEHNTPPLGTPLFTTPQNKEMEMEIVECNTGEYMEVRQNHGSFHTVKKKKKYEQEGTCIRPRSVSKVTVKHLKTGPLFLMLSQV